MKKDDGKKEGKNEPFFLYKYYNSRKMPHKNIVFLESIKGEKK